MADISDIELRRLDMTLLLVFEETIATGKLSAAARRLGLTQSAVSHALRRLRAIFDDELFVRLPHGVQPTPRAMALRMPLSEATRLIADAIRPAAFDPARDRSSFRIAASDHATALFAPRLLARRDADAVSYVFRPLLRAQAVAALGTGDIDIALGFMTGRPAGCESDVLLHETYLVVARRGHPALAAGRGRIAAYCASDHVVVAPGGNLGGIVDQALAERGLARRVVMAVPYFLTALAVVARTDCIATVPRRIALAHGRGYGLSSAEPPLRIRPFSISMFWNRRAGSRPDHAWLRERLRTAAVELDGGVG